MGSQRVEHGWVTFTFTFLASHIYRLPYYQHHSPERQFFFHQSCTYIAGEGNGTPLQYSCLENPMDGGAWCATVHEVAKSRTRLSDLTFTFHFHALEKEMATHSSVLAWRIPGTEEPGGLPSMGSHRVGHDWRDLATAAAAAATLLHHNHLKSIVYPRVPSWFCTFYEFGQKYNDIYLSF